MIQHALSRLRSAGETHAQALFQHLLGELIADLDEEDGEDEKNRVVNVDSKNADMTVEVHVCEDYFRSQKKPIPKRGVNQTLKIRSDLAVTAISDNKEDQLIRCLYNVEIEKALDPLKCSAIKQKSQLIAESLARSIKLKEGGGEPPPVVFSALTDCFCIHIMLHFHKSEKAYLSHREIIPGRMICVLAWLHLLSKNKKENQLTLNEFEGKAFIKIGESFKKEIENAVTKRAAEKKTQAIKPGQRRRHGLDSEHDGW